MTAGNSLVVTLGVAPADRARVRDVAGRWMKADRQGRRDVQMHLGMAAAIFTRELRKQFARHDRTGGTMRTLRIELEGMTAVVTMGGGGVFVEYGWTRGPMTAKPGGVFAWVDTDGQQRFARSVKGAHYVGDPFIERAMEKTDLAWLLRRIAYLVFSDMSGLAFDARGRQYTGGQQFHIPLSAAA